MNTKLTRALLRQEINSLMPSVHLEFVAICTVHRK